MRRFLSATLTAFMLTLCYVPSGWADDVTKQVEELSAKAAAAYGEGKYEESIDLFKQAYELQQVSNLLFNIAKVYEKIENWDEAENHYKEFIKAPDADSDAREVALERVEAIKEIKRLAAEAEEQKRRDEDERKRQEEEKALAQQQTETSKKKPNVLPWVLIGSGAAIAATGGVFGIMALGKQSDFDAAQSASEKADLRSSGKTFALIADVGVGVGLAAGVVGVVLLLTSGGESDAGASKAQAVLPTFWIGRDAEAGVGMNLRF